MMSNISKDFIIEEFKSVTKEVDYLIDSWSQFNAEPFMSGKIEGAEVIKCLFIKSFGKLMEACDG
jgi:hypothetical protein